MKQYLAIASVIISLLLATALVVTKRSDNALLETAAGTITEFSNRLDEAQSKIVVRDGTILTWSNSLAASSAAALTLSNQLNNAQSAVAISAEQITNLTRQVTAVTAEKQSLSEQVVKRDNQLAVLTNRIDWLQASLNQTNLDLVQARKDYVLMQNRFQRDVAERIVVERRFNNLAEILAQEQKLKNNPATAITAQSIYAGMNVEVKSNGMAYVISPD
jgi:chromosome segregation ATPase